jgi:hypothetical protein
MALARALFLSEESAAANQMDVSTKRLTGREPLAPSLAAHGTESLGNHRILVLCDV